MATYTPVSVVAAGGIPVTQVTKNAPAMTVIDPTDGVPPPAVAITLTANARPVMLFDEAGDPYEAD